MTRRRARRTDDPALEPDTAILRGHPLTPEELRANAVDNFDVYGFYGISVFRGDDAAGVDTICRTKLRAIPVVGLFRVSDLVRGGLELWATGAWPHYDVIKGPSGEDLGDLVSRMLAVPRNDVDNPHFREGEGR